jgi:hypothetical protein
MKTTNDNTNSKHTKANDREGLKQTPTDSSSEAAKTKIVAESARQLGKMPEDGDPLPIALTIFMVELHLDLEAVSTLTDVADAEFDRITQEDKFAVNIADSDEGDRGSGLMVISIPGSM